MLEGIEETLKGLAKRTPSGRRSWSCGPAASSSATTSHARLLGQIEESGAALHVLTVGTTVPPDAMTPEGRSREIVFDSGTRQSGGRRQNVLSSMALPDALTKLAAELLGQYRITYARPETLIPPKTIEVDGPAARRHRARDAGDRPAEGTGEVTRLRPGALAAVAARRGADGPGPAGQAARLRRPRHRLRPAQADAGVPQRRRPGVAEHDGHRRRQPVRHSTWAPETSRSSRTASARTISFFSRTTLPLSVSLLLDSSASMDDKIKTAQRAALGFVAALRPQDQAQVIDFDSRVSVVAPFTASRADLEKAISSTIAGGSTSLYNAIYIALRELNKVQSRSAEDLRRQAIVVLSDGEDTSSLVSYDEVLELAKRSETVIYAIGIRSKDGYTGKGYSDADYVLRQLTTQTGGRVFFPAGAEELPAIYALISEELSSQYVLGYTSKNPRRDGRWRRIQVRVARPGATARTRQGYYAPGG